MVKTELKHVRSTSAPKVLLHPSFMPLTFLEQLAALVLSSRFAQKLWNRSYVDRASFISAIQIAVSHIGRVAVLDDITQ
jgi:hypothetical protein